MFKGGLLLLLAAATGFATGTNISHEFRPVYRPFSDELMAQLKVRPGFKINAFARGQGNARMMLLLPDGTILMTRNDVGEVVALRDLDGDGVADEAPVVARSTYVHGLALRDNVVYLANETRLLTMTLNTDGTFGTPVEFAEVPAGGLHPRRTIGFDDTGWLYVSVGSDCNNCGQVNPELATILRMKPDGSERSIFASGLRNALGFAWHPLTHQMWAWDNGSDGRGDNIPPEELNLLEEGNNYGWPSCYGKRVPDKVTRADPTVIPVDCADTTPMVRGYTAHCAPITFLFYTATNFPASYQNQGFVSFHGSWNRVRAMGYKVVCVRFSHGQPVGFRDFVSGWLIEKGTAYFGRPAGLVIARDGSLLISDDVNGIIYRVSSSAHAKK